MQIKEAMGELATTAEAVKEEFVRSNSPYTGGLLDHGEQDEIETDVFIEDSLVVVDVLWVDDACGEEWTHYNTIMLFTEFRKVR
jgi:hypothetical protein